MLYKWKNVVLQMLLMRLRPSLTADQTRYLLHRPFFVLVSQAIFMWESSLPPPAPNNNDWVLPTPAFHHILCLTI